MIRFLYPPLQLRIVYSALLTLGIQFSCLSKADAAAIIEGVVTDSLYHPVEVVTVNLFKAADSVFIKAELTDVDGRFQFAAIPPGLYYVAIVFLGYQEYHSEVFTIAEDQTTFAMPDIHLIPAGLALDEVSVIAQRPFIERRADRLIVNVENSSVAAGSTALEVLQRSPGVIVNSDDAISIRGRSGVIFMIDGKITPLTGQDLANYLRNLPSGDIDHIEIITNPSAKYDAAGNAGIIDIRLKKNTRNGTNGSATANVNQGKYPKAGAGITLNHRQDKVNVFGSYNHNYRKGFNDLRLYRVFLANGDRTGAYAQKNYLTIPFHFNTARLGIDYYASSNTVMGILASGSLNQFRREGKNTSQVEDEMAQQVSSFNTESDSRDRWPSYAFNGNFKHTFPAHKQEISFDLDYARYWNTSDQNFLTRYYDLSGAEYLPYYLLVGDLSGNLEIKSAKGDYVYPISKKVKLECGVKTSLVHADNDIEFIDESDPEHAVVDSTVSNHFIYNENINAAYVN
ncbi:MAG TPA: outer membrane beta-barrel protein, partial [Saprospiraceae bacterium]|nr:outer membrane beta-barrel protein [Saprospiraceae bacterium]